MRRLVWWEEHASVLDAIAREKVIKRWRRAWKLALIETDNPQWANQLRRLSRYRDTYVEVVNRWNAWIELEPNVSRPPEHFVAYVLQVYERLATLDAQIGDDALSLIEHTWASLAADAPLTGGQQDEPAWISYLRRVRGVVDQFFPDLPPLPFARITLE